MAEQFQGKTEERLKMVPLRVLFPDVFGDQAPPNFLKDVFNHAQAITEPDAGAMCGRLIHPLHLHAETDRDDPDAAIHFLYINRDPSELDYRYAEMSFTEVTESDSPVEVIAIWRMPRLDKKQTQSLDIAFTEKKYGAPLRTLSIYPAKEKVVLHDFLSSDNNSRQYPGHRQVINYKDFENEALWAKISAEQAEGAGKDSIRITGMRRTPQGLIALSYNCPPGNDKEIVLPEQFKPRELLNTSYCNAPFLI